MKLLVIAGPYEADRIRRAAVAGGLEALVLEPGDSVSGTIGTSRPDVVVLAPRVLHPDARVAIGKVRAIPAGTVPLFLVGDADDERDLAALAEGFFVRPLSPSDLVQEIRGRVAEPARPAAEDEEFASEGSGRRPPSLRPLQAGGGGAEAFVVVSAPMPALFGSMEARIDAALDAEFEEAVRTVGGFRRPADWEPVATPEAEARAAVEEFSEATSHKTVEAPEQLVADMLARQAPPGGVGGEAPAAGVPAAAPALDLPRRGALGAEDVAGLLARIYRAGWSGRLRVRRADVEKTVSFDSGHAVMATSSLPADRMADMLFREGKITREQYASGGQLVSATGRRMGAVLVDLGFIKMSELFPSVRRHYEEIIHSLFAWEDGEWTLEDVPAPDSEKIRLSRHPAALVLEGLRRKGDAARLRDRVGGPRVVLRPSGDRAADVIAESTLTVSERMLVPFLDGSRTLEQARATAGVAEADAYAVAWGLVALGALAPVTVPAPGPAAAPALAAAAAPAAAPPAAAAPAPGPTPAHESDVPVTPSARARAAVIEQGGGSLPLAPPRTPPRSDGQSPPALARSTRVAESSRAAPILEGSRSALGPARDRDIDRERVLARYALVQEADYFQLLGVRSDASAHEVRRAYDMLRREFSPDRFDAAVSAELGPEIAAIQEVIDEGMRVLGDEDLRRLYQQSLSA